MLFATDPLIGTAGTIASFLVLVGGGVAWWLNWRKSTRKDTVDELWVIIHGTQAELDKEKIRAREKELEYAHKLDELRANCDKELKVARDGAEQEAKVLREEWYKESKELREKNEQAAKELQEAWHKETKEWQNKFHSCEMERSQREGEIRLMQASLRRLQEYTGTQAPSSTTPGVILADLTGKVKLVSPTFTLLFGWLPQDLVNKSLQLIVPERFHKAYAEGLERVKATGQPPWTEKTVITVVTCKNGTETPVLVNLSVIPTNGGAYLIGAEVKRRMGNPNPGSDPLSHDSAV